MEEAVSYQSEKNRSCYLRGCLRTSDAAPQRRPHPALKRRAEFRKPGQPGSVEHSEMISNPTEPDSIRLTDISPVLEHRAEPIGQSVVGILRPQLTSSALAEG
jgi:hypothetical protein